MYTIYNKENETIKYCLRLDNAIENIANVYLQPPKISYKTWFDKCVNEQKTEFIVFHPNTHIAKNYLVIGKRTKQPYVQAILEVLKNIRLNNALLLLEDGFKSGTQPLRDGTFSILVDIQNDFVPGGALPVPEGDQIIPVVNQLLPAFDLVVATQDWHPQNHGSFASNHPCKKIYDVIEKIIKYKSNNWSILKVFFKYILTGKVGLSILKVGTIIVLFKCLMIGDHPMYKEVDISDFSKQEQLGGV